MPTRRQILKGLFATVLAGLFVSLYATIIEPLIRLNVTTWKLSPKTWRKGQKLRIAIVTDIHMGEPFSGLKRLRRIVKRTNALGADVIFLLGDHNASHRFISKHVPINETAKELAKLHAPLGVHSVLGNHDWWDDAEAQRTGKGPIEAQRVFEAEGIPVLQNKAIKLGGGKNAFWLLGLGDQMALRNRPLQHRGVDDLPETLAQITDDDPAILLAHEPDIFPEVPDRVALTLSGHTHGGQIRLFGWAPVVPSRFGNRFVYGHIQEQGRDLVVSGGLGCSILPIRIGSVPEITVVELS
ncbi:metallophosphoesterase [Amylibacter sp. SFDW26]|uniref:metallophosphoesterase n=1 Tax=Amylibacter sp. SFDW26 TaxID=2652722 RepID=UPI001261E69B|nr:metallophosphoesterase [Amylibacter sp. SFDW26]KAB7616250.1 metallophosphoesterase [Amylibacter sp. SFDW26]